MPDELIDETPVDDEVRNEVHDEVHDELEPDAPEPEQPDVEDEPAGPTPGSAMFEELFPEMAGQYEKIPQDVRDTMILRELRRLRSQPDRSSEPDETSEAAAVDDSLQRFAGMTREDITKALDRHALEGDSSGVAELFDVMFNAMQRQAELVNGALGGMGRQVQSLSRPVEVRQALRAVPGAADSDMDRALEILNSGDQTDSPMVALKLAVFERQASGERHQADSAATRERKASAISASRRASGSEPDGRPRVRMDMTDEEFRGLMAQELREGGLIKGARR